MKTDHGGGRGRKSDEAVMLTLVEIELGEPQCREHGQKKRQVLQYHDVRAADREKHHGGKDTETDIVRQRVQLLSYFRICFQKPCGQTIAEIKGGGADHQDKSQLQPAVQRSDYPQNPAKEVHRGNRVRNVLDDAHYLIPSFFLRSLERASLWTTTSMVLERRNESEQYQIPRYLLVVPQEFLIMK